MVVLSHLHNIHMQRCLASHFTTIFPLVDLKKGRKILHFSKDNSLFSSKHGKTQKNAGERGKPIVKRRKSTFLNCCTTELKF